MIWNYFTAIAEAAITIAEVEVIIEAIELYLDFKIFFDSNLVCYCCRLVNYY